MEEYYGQFISEDSVIRLTDGTEMKGKFEVTKGILECCETYHKEHVSKMKLEFIKYGMVGVGIGVIAGVGIKKIIEWKKKNTDK